MGSRADAILALLEKRSMSVNELSRELGFSWRANVNKALDALDKFGLVEKIPDERSPMGDLKWRLKPPQTTPVAPAEVVLSTNLSL